MPNDVSEHSDYESQVNFTPQIRLCSLFYSLDTGGPSSSRNSILGPKNSFIFGDFQREACGILRCHNPFGSNPRTVHLFS
jgi:hypothetical protein